MSARQLIVGLMTAAAVAMGGCGDDAHKGTISHGSATPHGSGAAAGPAQKDLALKLDPGTPLMTAPVAVRVRKRLKPLGIDYKRVRIDGAHVKATLPQDKLEASRKELSTGRLDILLIETKKDRLAGADEDEAAKRFAYSEETVPHKDGTRTLHFLRAKPSERDALSSYLQSKLGPQGVIGPLFEGSAEPSALRSYAIQDGRVVRGEHILTVSSAEEDGTTSVRVTFTPAATAGLRWHIKHKSRFLLYADSDALSTITPEALNKDDSLSFPLASRGDPQTTKNVAEALAKRMSGISLSHRTKLLP